MKARTDTSRLKWFMEVMQTWFSRPDKASVIDVYRGSGNRVEKWVQVEMGAALQSLHDGRPGQSGYGCWEIEVEKCDIYIAQEPWEQGMPWPLPSAADDLWVELKCRSTKDLQGLKGLLADVCTDIGKQRKRRRQHANVGHFIAVALILFEGGTSRQTIDAWKTVLSDCHDTEVMFRDIVGKDGTPMAMLAGWE